MHSKTILRFFEYFAVLLLFAAPFGLSAQISGCTDPLSLNYNPAATVNDGSCAYEPTSIVPTNSFPLGTLVSETSGLIFWNGQLFTHNDNDDTNLYALSPTDGTILETYSLSTTSNTDWEAISQDVNYIYVGDFGNNSHGNRSDLKIYRILKSSLLSGTPQIDTIHFVYEDQVDFSEQTPNTTDFDCEALIVSSDKIFLFTKQWQSNNTAIYSLSKTPGDQVANFEGTLNTNGMVTGATYLEAKRLVVLSGYTTLLQPFVYLLYDFEGQDFTNGNKRKVNLNLPLHQIEGIATENGKDYFLSNEYFYLNGSTEIPQQLHTLDLNGYLGDYLDNLNTNNFGETNAELSIYPNPANSIITISSETPLKGSNYTIFDEMGQILQDGTLNFEQSIIISDLKSGLYFLKLVGNDKQVLKLIIK